MDRLFIYYHQTGAINGFERGTSAATWYSIAHKVCAKFRIGKLEQKQTKTNDKANSACMFRSTLSTVNEVNIKGQHIWYGAYPWQDFNLHEVVGNV